MTSPNAGRPPERRRNRLWRTVGLAFGAGSLVLGAGAAVWAWNFIRNDLTPFLSERLTESLERPVDLGPVERVTLNSIRVGPTAVGSTPTDPTTVSAEAVEVQFNLLGSLLSRKLDLDLTIFEADGYIEQDPQKGWFSFELPEQEEPQQEPLFEVRLDEVNVRNSQVTAVPYFPEANQQTPIVLNSVNGLIDTDFIKLQGIKTQRLNFDVATKVAAGGDLSIQGEIEPQLVPETSPEASEDTSLVRSTNLAVQANQVSLPSAARLLQATLNQQQLPLSVEDGTISSNLKLRIRPEQPIDLEGTASIDQGKVQIEALAQPLTNLAADVRLKGSEIFLDKASTELGAIKATAEGSLDLQDEIDLTTRLADVTVENLTEAFELDLPISLTGTFDSEVKVSGKLAQPFIEGNIAAQDTVTVDKVALDTVDTQFSLQWPSRQLVIDGFRAVPTAGGQLGGQGAIDFSDPPANILMQFEGQDLPADAIATLYGLDLPITLGTLAAKGTLTGSPGDLETTVQWQAPEAQYPGQGTLVYALNGKDNSLTFRDTTIQIGNGLVRGAGSLINNRWQADIALVDIALNQFAEAAPGILSGDFQLAGTTQNTNLSGIQAQGNFQLQQLAAGTLAGNATVNNGRWGLDLDLVDIQLNQLAQNLRGAANGQILITGVTDNLSLAAMRAQGDLALTEGLSALSPQLAGFNQPLSSTLAWDGQRLLIDRARSEQLQASGVVIPQFNGYQFLAIQQFDLDITAQNYPLATAPIPTSESVQLGGLATFAGTLTGTPSTPNLTGRLQLNNLAVNQLFFDPLLTGQVNYTEGALNLALAGRRDQINVNFQNPRDFNFAVNWQDAFAQGETEGDSLNARFGNFPLAALQLPSRNVSPIGPVRGTVSSPALSFNLANQTLMGAVSIDNLGIGHIGVDQVAGQIRYANNLVTLLDGKVFFEESFYQVTGRLDLANDFAYLANIKTDQGKIQDLLTALSIFQIEDFARGFKTPEWIQNPIEPEQVPTVLATQPAGDTNASLLAQLRRLAEIQAIRDSEQLAAEQAPLPPLRELDGPFVGTVNLAGSRSNSLDVNFDLLGDSWQWGQDFSADRVIAKGSYTNGMLVFEPLRLESTLPIAFTESSNEQLATVPSESSNDADESSTNTDEATTDSSALSTTSSTAFINLAGQFIFGSQSDAVSNLQLIAKNISVDKVRDIFNLPLSLEGRINGTATFGGNLNNPQIRGVARLVEASINRSPIETAQAQFLYQEARLSLLSTLTAQDNPEPLRLSAQIPYAFGFMTVQPASDQILLDVEVKDEGLALLNIINRQVSWESGEGDVSLSVRGTISNPQIEGFATLRNSTIRARVLPEPLTNINGSAQFIRDRITIEQLTGEFSNGQVTAAGTFPIVFPIIGGADLAQLGAPPATELVTEDDNKAPLEDTIEPSPINGTSPDIAIATEEIAPEDSATEELPALEVVSATESPLTINLENIALNLKGLYDGRVNGRVVIGGSLLLGGPQLGGQVQLSQGRIFLPENNASSGGTTTAADTAASSPGGLSITPRFQNLSLSLGRSVQIIQGNLLNFFAEGALQMNGPIAVKEIQPSGTIRLITGRVNLFTTSFRLAGNNNTATFLPEIGLTDPILNVNLRTSVAEATSSGPTTATAFSTSEVTDTSLDPFRTSTGSLETVRIRASVNGPSSQIFNNLVLSSSPPRTQNEIIGLIGGSFLTALESGGSGDLSGVVNLFGGVLLNRLQDFVSSTLNLSEFRLFPVTSASRFSNDENTGSTLDLGGEIGFDVSNNFTVSILKILTDSTPTEFNLRYRLNDQFTIRTTTNLDDVNRVLLEFETRF